MHEVKDSAKRIAAIAKEYAKSPENTLVVSPDNRSRAQINAAIRSELQAKGVVSREEYRVDALVPRQDLTGADRTRAQRYQANDVLLYARSSKETGIEKGEYTRVKSVDSPNNLLTVVRIDGSEQTYDPRRQQGVSIYREQQMSFSVGDRIQFTAPAKEDPKFPIDFLAAAARARSEGRRWPCRRSLCGEYRRRRAGRIPEAR